MTDESRTFYTTSHRALQDRFETRGLADRLESEDVVDHLGKYETKFIETAAMFFLTTIDHTGQPTVSYKGGKPGFVRVLDSRLLAFPSYNGNGMYYSTGNLGDNPKVGLLFIDFERPQRLRIHGNACISLEDPLLAEFPGAQFIVRVQVREVFDNCSNNNRGYRNPSQPHQSIRKGVSKLPEISLQSFKSGSAYSSGTRQTLPENVPLAWPVSSPFSNRSNVMTGSPGT